MLFIPNGDYACFKGADSCSPHKAHIEKGDICFVLVYETELTMRNEPLHRSLVLHPTYGLIYTFVFEKRGQLIGELNE